MKKLSALFVLNLFFLSTAFASTEQKSTQDNTGSPFQVRESSHKFPLSIQELMLMEAVCHQHKGLSAEVLGRLWR